MLIYHGSSNYQSYQVSCYCNSKVWLFCVSVFSKWVWISFWWLGSTLPIKWRLNIFYAEFWLWDWLSFCWLLTDSFEAAWWWAWPSGALYPVKSLINYSSVNSINFVSPITNELPPVEPPPGPALNLFLLLSLNYWIFFKLSSLTFCTYSSDLWLL